MYKLFYHDFIIIIFLILNTNQDNI